MVNNIEIISKIEDFIIIYFILCNTYYTNLKFANIEVNRKKLLVNIVIFIVTIICAILNGLMGIFYNIIIRIILISYIFKKTSNLSMSRAIIITLLSMSLNYIIFSFSAFIEFLLYRAINIENDHINLLIILLLYIINLTSILKIRKLRKGISFLYKKLEDEIIEIFVLNISTIILFSIIVLSNYNKISSNVFGVGLVIVAIIFFLTIQESLQLYYKQKMLIKDLEETKAELENKKKEVEELEKENLNFSKVSHSIAHKQKSLEFKLNELSMKSEISSEINLKDRVDKLGKALTKETISVIDKTGIEEIDDMLKYMQAECIKNKIDFQLQISGNIYTMINHYIDKEELEILLADHIKNAIIAIGYGDNINKSILVRLGKLDGYYGLYIYDSGIEFEIETLYKLGKIPATTHKDNGGTGMGFMNTFDTLRKHKASFVIEEYGKPVKNNFTKALKFIFNGKNEFKIYSYRNEEIEKENKENDLVVEKLNI